MEEAGSRYTRATSAEGTTQRSTSRARPETSISRFSEALNKKLANVLSARTISGMKTLTDLNFGQISTDRPSFVKIIERLDDITEKKNLKALHSALVEEELYSFSLSKREKLNFHIETLNRVSPLTLTLNQGAKVTVFISESVPIPDDSSYDRKFQSELIQVFDKNYRFKSKNLFFTLIAFEQCEIRFSFSFRKKEKMSRAERLLRFKSENDKEIQKIRSDIHLKEKFVAHVEQILANRKERTLELSKNKNFLKKNKTFQTPEEKKIMVKSKSEEKIRRDREAQVKRTCLFLEKKKRFQEIFRKQQEKFRERVEKEVRMKEREKIDFRLKTWISWVFLIKTAGIVMEKFRGFKCEAIRKRNSVARIQKNYRRWNTKFFDNVAKEMIHARNACLMYREQLGHLKKSFKSKFIRFINQSISDQKPFLVFENYIKKVLFIQKFFKEYLTLRDFLMNQGVKIWMVQISRIVKKFIKSSPKSQFVEQVMKIKEVHRNDYLKDLVREKCRNRRVTWHNISQFIPSKGEVFKLIKIATFNS